MTKDKDKNKKRVPVELDRREQEMLATIREHCNHSTDNAAMREALRIAAKVVAMEKEAQEQRPGNIVSVTEFDTSDKIVKSKIVIA